MEVAVTCSSSRIGRAFTCLFSMFFAGMLASCTGAVITAPQREEQSQPLFTLESPYLAETIYRHKAQTHVHSHAGADAAQSRFEVERTYRTKGYDVIFLTDHNQVTEDPRVGCDEKQRCILHIPGAESGWACRHHMIVLGANEPEMLEWPEDIVGVSDAFTNETWSNRCSAIQERINDLGRNGALVILAHPMGEYYLGGTYYDLNELFAEGYVGIEIWTPGSDSRGWWNQLSGAGRRIWGLASDDCEDLNGRSFNRGWIMVRSGKVFSPEDMNTSKEEELRQDILQNIRAGNFWAVVRGPEADPGLDTDDDGPLVAIVVDGATLRVVTDQPNSRIRFIGHCTLLKEDVGQGASYTADGTERYLRVEIEQQRNGTTYVAYSQPVFINDTDPNDQGVEGRVNMSLNFVHLNFLNQCGNVNHPLLVKEDPGDYRQVLPAGQYFVRAEDKYHEAIGKVLVPISGFVHLDLTMQLKPGMKEP